MFFKGINDIGIIKRARASVFWPEAGLVTRYEFLCFPERRLEWHEMKGALVRAFEQMDTMAPDRALWWRELLDKTGMYHIPIIHAVEQYPYDTAQKIDLDFLCDYRREMLSIK